MKQSKSLIVMPLYFLLVACAQTESARIDAAAQSVGGVRASETWPEYPAECRRVSRAGLQEGDRLDVAVLKLDAALTQQNERAQWCAAWYDQLTKSAQNG